MAQKFAASFSTHDPEAGESSNYSAAPKDNSTTAQQMVDDLIQQAASSANDTPKNDNGSKSNNSKKVTLADIEGGEAQTAGAADDKQQRQEAAKKAWGKLFFLLHLAFHLGWLYIHTRIFGQWALAFIYGQWSSSNRKILIIGDDLAVGVGDWITMGSQPGLQGRLNKVINKDVLKRLVGRGVLWTAFTSAKAGSTTEDWLPVTQMSTEQKIRFAAKNGAVGKDGKRKKPKATARGGGDNDGEGAVGELCTEGITVQDALTLRGASLFDKNFHPNTGMHKDADIVIIVLGSKDRCTILETVQNISKITSELIKQGKHVIVTSIPLPPSAFQSSREVLVRFRDRNEAMLHMVSGMQSLEKIDERNRTSVSFASGSASPHPSVVAGAAPNSILKQRSTVAGASDNTAGSEVTPVSGSRVALARVAESLTQDQCYRFGGKVFNGQGYTRAGDVILAVLTPMMRSIDGRREVKQAKRME